MAAVPSTIYRALFEGAAAAYEMREPGDPAALLPNEAAFSVRVVAKRVREFAAGRVCARRALADCGVADFALRTADDRQPVWPQQVIGSITHTDGFCAAVAMHRGLWAGIGIDTEQLKPVREGVAEHVCTPDELDCVLAMPEAERTAAILLIFSAKEAFYKSQYPATGEMLSFKDVRVVGGVGAEPLAGLGQVGKFQIEPLRTLAVTGLAHFPACGRYSFHEHLVSTGIRLRARPAAA